MTTFLHKNDLPASVEIGDIVAIDTEAMGLQGGRDRLCLVQLSFGDGDAHLVQIPNTKASGERISDIAPVLHKLLSNSKVEKIFHYARFDVGILQRSFECDIENIYCTKIASRLCRTYCNNHGLKDLCRDILDINISKQQTTSDWGKESLSKGQIDYAASDVLYLHKLRRELNILLKREGRHELAIESFRCIPVISKLDNMGWSEKLFCHSYSD